MLEPGRRIGDWIVEERIGAGAMGSVYRCHSVLSEHLRAAIKVLRRDAMDDTRARFLREVETLARLDHRAIVRILGSGEDPHEGVLYLVMELLEGESLASRLQSGPVDVRTAVRWFHRLALALSHAHEQGVAHRDVKPSNIMLLHNGEVRLVDFGIAVTEDGPPITQTGIVVGTFSYLAPEAFLESNPDLALCDQYSLAQVMCEVLGGAPAFPRPGGVEEGRWMALLARQKSDSEALDPGERTPSGLRAIIRRGTQREPGKRFPSMAHLAEALAEVSLIAPAARRSGSNTSSGPVTSAMRRGAVPTGPSARAVALGAGTVGFALAIGVAAVAWTLQPKPAPRIIAAAPAPKKVEEPRSGASPAATPEPEAPEVPPAPEEAGPAYALVSLKAGTFEMGCTPAQMGCGDDEQPITRVRVSRGFSIGRTEVTQDLWTRIMGDNPAVGAACGGDCPVENVSWCDAVLFANALSASEGLDPAYQLPERMKPGLQVDACNALAPAVRVQRTASGYRLPTEAEWEYAARAGKDTRYPGGDDADDLAWHAGNAAAALHPVGQKRPNRWGVHDMAGNVWEWVEDGYGAYPGGATTDRLGDAGAPYKVLRGGGWRSLGRDVRLAERDRAYPGARDDGTGFRLVRSR